MTLFFTAVVTGILIGFVSGLLGVGGGMIMVPVFRLAFGLSPVMSTATSLFAIIPTSISGAITHIRGKTCILKLGVVLGIGGACTSPLGVWLANMSPGWLVISATAAVIAYSGVTMLRKALKAPRMAKARKVTASEVGEAVDRPAATTVPTATGVVPAATTTSATTATAPAAAAPAAITASAAGIEPTATATAAAAPAAGTAPTAPAAAPFTFDLTPRNIALGIGIGLVTGVASGYVGLGGGFIMIPLMMTLFDMDMHQTSGTSLIAIMMLALPGTILQCSLGNVDYVVGIAICCGSIPGALVGAKLVPYLPERALRFTFAAFLGTAAILLVLKELGMLG